MVEHEVIMIRFRIYHPFPFSSISEISFDLICMADFDEEVNWNDQ